MPIDFTTYRDPGVYVESITPSAIDSGNLAPTLVGIMGEAPAYKDSHESWALSRSSTVRLDSKGVNPASIGASNILTREQYVSGALGVLETGLGASNSTTSASITLYDNIVLPSSFDIRIGDEIIAVSSVSGGAFTITRTNAVTHAVGAVVNIYEAYDQGSSLGTLNAPISAAQTTFSVTASGSLTSDSYIEVEGERMLLVSSSSGSGQNEKIVVVVRGVCGTQAKSHGTSPFYATSGAHFFVVNENDRISLGIVDDALDDSTTVDVYLQNADEEKYLPTIVDRMDAVIEKYGAPFGSGGVVNSPLSLAAQLAFANGAERLVLLQVEDSDPDWDTAFDLMARETSVNTLVALTADDTILQLLRVKNNQLASQSIFRHMFVGLDGVGETLTHNAFIDAAQFYFDERVTVVAPGRFSVVTGRGSRETTDVPGFYAAAALAGVQASQEPQEPLTRKQIYGITAIPNQDSLTNIITMQAKGVTVLYQDRLGRVIVKHGLTTNITNLYTKEISIVVSRDRLQSFIQDTLDSGNLIGSAMTSRTPNLVLASVTGCLETAMTRGLIYDYSDVMYRVPDSNPTVVEIRFMYKPTLPLNYIYVQFTIDTATGSLEFTTVNN